MATTERKSGARRREEIARAVLRIIGERGLPSLTTASLAAEVGVTTGALFRHFASLDEILAETARHGVERIEATFPREALPPLPRLLALGRNRVQALGAEPGLVWLLRSEQAALSLPAPAVQRLRAVVGRTRQFVLDLLREGAADGSIRGDIEPEVLLVPVLATIHAAIGARAAGRRRPSGERQDPEQVLRALARLLAPADSAPLPEHGRSRKGERR